MSYPLLYEVNTRCWLRALSEKSGQDVKNLGDVPDEELERWQSLGFTHIWPMGVWPTSPRSRTVALASPGLRRALSETLPDWKPDDAGGSPFAVDEYNVPAALGGETGLQKLRRKLNARGLKLVLDFVPNHVGLDHDWLTTKPELFVQAPAATPETFALETLNGTIRLAHGKDPNFPAWIDTVQLDYRVAGTHAAMTDVLKSIAGRCDGVRCDMAMLLLRDTFAQTWERFPCLGATTEREFWADAIQVVKRSQPDFLFLGEVYWDLEARLQEMGFDYTYDKRLYDYLVYRNHSEAQRHVLNLTPEFINASAHFLENHDEPRIASILSPEEHWAAALLTLGLPGLRLLHDGQLEGARIKVPVQLSRRPVEPAEPEVAGLYRHLLASLQSTAVGTGKGEVLKPRPAWADNPTSQSFVIVQWQSGPEAFDLVVVNFAAHRSQCVVSLTISGLALCNWRMKDLLGDEEYHRFGDDLQNQGLYLDLPRHGAQLFHFTPLI